MDEAALSLFGQRYCTSKLAGGLEGLHTLRTYGFRGEAVASLAELCKRLWVRTARAGDTHWREKTLERGQQPTAQAVQLGPARGAADQGQSGTKIRAEGLFTALPVRREQAAARSADGVQAVHALVLAYGLARPALKLHVRATRAALLRPSLPDLPAALAHAFGAAVASQLQPLVSSRAAAANGISVCLYLPRPPAGPNWATMLRARPDRSFVFVNQRPVDHRSLTQLINSHLRAFSSDKRYPTFVCLLTVPPQTYDVNVTPDKRRLFFDQELERLVLDEVRSMLVTTYPLESCEQRAIPATVSSSDALESEAMATDEYNLPATQLYPAPPPPSISARSTSPVPNFPSLHTSLAGISAALEATDTHNSSRHLVGPLPQAPGLFVVCDRSSLWVFSPSRGQCLLTFNRMLQTYVTPTEELPQPITLSRSTLADDRCWNLLGLIKDLSGSTVAHARSAGTTPASHMAAALGKNGFDVRFRAGSFELVALASCLKIADLRPFLLEYIEAGGCDGGERIRPKPVIDNIVAQLKSNIYAAEMDAERVFFQLDLLNKPVEEYRCPHGKEVYSFLCPVP